MRQSILYVVGAYPQRSETFVTREVAGLRRHVPVRVLALRDGDGGAPEPPPCARDWSAARQLLPVLLRDCRDMRQRLQVLQALPRFAAGLALPRGSIARVHAHFATVPALVGMHLARHFGVPFSFTAHAYDLFTARSLFALVAPAADVIITPADYHRRWIAERYHAATVAKVRVVRCGIPDHWLRYPAADAAGTTGVVGIGRLVPKKGFDLLVQVLRDMPDMRWHIAGDGPQRRQLQRLLSGDPWRRTRLLRWHDERFVRFLQTTNICVFPCRTAPDGDHDGLPVTLLEAMALGAPVVATPVAGIPEAVTDGVNGLLVPENDSAALADSIRRLRDDGALRARLGAAARATVQQRFLRSRSTRALLDVCGVPAPLPPGAGAVPRARPLRVLRVINNLDTGGAQRLLVQWAKHHDRARFTTVVAAFRGGPLADELAAAGVPVHFVPRRGKYDVSLIGRLAQLMRDERIDLVHAQLFAAKFWARLAARRAGVPCAVSEYAAHPRTRRFPYPQLERYLAPHTAGWAIDHPEGIARLVTQGAAPERITIIPAGVERERLQATRPRAAIRAALAVPAAAVMALGLGRLTEQKGFAALLERPLHHPEAARAAAAMLRIVISGDGPQRAELAAYCARPELQGLAQVAGPEWPAGDLLAAADVLVLPSRWEGLPLAVLEAAAVGLPVIASDLPGLHALAEEWPGLTLVPDADGIFRQLLALAQQAQQHGRRPARQPHPVADAAAYARTLATWYDGTADARA